MLTVGVVHAGAAKAVVPHSNSISPGMPHPNSHINPADVVAAVGLPSAHPIAAHGMSTAAAVAPQLGQGSPASKPAMQRTGSAAVPHQDIESTVQGSLADPTGTAALHAHSSEEDMQGGAVSTAQLAMQSKETDKTAMDVQHVQNLVHVETPPCVVELEPVRGLADPNKRLLAKMGSHAPSDVSKQLLQEVAARSHVQGLLQVCRPPQPPKPPPPWRLVPVLWS